MPPEEPPEEARAWQLDWGEEAPEVARAWQLDWGEEAPEQPPQVAMAI